MILLNTIHKFTIFLIWSTKFLKKKVQVNQIIAHLGGLKIKIEICFKYNDNDLKKYKLVGTIQ